MDPDAEGGYRARLLTCHGCAEREKAGSDDNPEPGLQIAIERI